MKIVFFIGNLNTGGAERQLSVLAAGFARLGHEVDVVTIFPGGQNAEYLESQSDVKLHSLWSSRSGYLVLRLIQLLLSPIRLRRLLSRELSLYSMLEAPNFIAWLATRFMKNVRLVWGIRSTSVESHWKMIMFEKLCAVVSSGVDLMISNSNAGLKSRLIRGYRPKKHIVIPNGIDTDKFQRHKESLSVIRNELGVSVNQPLIGLVARLDPMKDHQTFMEAALLVLDEVTTARFICVGDGPDAYTRILHNKANALGLSDKIIWLGDRSDIVSIYSALNVLVLSSSCCEGFSNVIGEAMSCGLPCVVTDVGDSSYIVADSNRVVEPANKEKLAQAIIYTLQNTDDVDWAEISRARIINNFSTDRLIDRTLQSLCGSCSVE